MNSTLKSASTLLMFLLLASGTASAQMPDPAHAAPAPPNAPEVSDLPILGVAEVSFKVSDLDKARTYYKGILGFDEAFDLKDASGKITSAFFKVNDEQYIELTPDLKPGELVRQNFIVIQASDLAKLREIYAQRGLNPTTIATGADGNPAFAVTAPNGAVVKFLQYVPGSKQGMLRGKDVPDTRISNHIWHAGTMVKDDATRVFFQERLGFGRLLPGGRNEFVELPASDSNLETRNPPLDPNNPATKDQYTQEVYGAVYHFSLEVSDMRKARDTAQKRGHLSDLQVRAAMGRGQRRWLMHLYDPDGTRTEFMETQNRDLPPNTVMAPGPEAPPIMPAAGGGFGWPAPDPSK
jgi:catechol 2,3-dioxygenase-like lactoylglutathione lyase family enzyme